MTRPRKNHAKPNGYHLGIGAAVRRAVQALKRPATATEIAQRISKRRGTTVTRQAVECHIRAMVKEGTARKVEGAVQPVK